MINYIDIKNKRKKKKNQYHSDMNSNVIDGNAC